MKTQIENKLTKLYNFAVNSSFDAGLLKRKNLGAVGYHVLSGNEETGPGKQHVLCVTFFYIYIWEPEIELK